MLGLDERVDPCEALFFLFGLKFQVGIWILLFKRPVFRGIGLLPGTDRGRFLHARELIHEIDVRKVYTNPHLTLPKEEIKVSIKFGSLSAFTISTSILSGSRYEIDAMVNKSKQNSLIHAK